MVEPIDLENSAGPRQREVLTSLAVAGGVPLRETLAPLASTARPLSREEVEIQLEVLRAVWTLVSCGRDDLSRQVAELGERLKAALAAEGWAECQLSGASFQVPGDFPALAECQLSGASFQVPGDFPALAECQLSGASFQVPGDFQEGLLVRPS